MDTTRNTSMAMQISTLPAMLLLEFQLSTLKERFGERAGKGSETRHVRMPARMASTHLL